MKISIRQVVGFCRDHPVCWTPLLIGAACVETLNGVAKYGRQQILEWVATRQSVLGGSMPLSQNSGASQRAMFASTILETAINMTIVLVMAIAFVAMARLAEKAMVGVQFSTAELLGALKGQFRDIAWFWLQYSVCLFAVTLIGSLLISFPGVTILFGVTYLHTSPPLWVVSLAEKMAVAYVLAIPALRLISTGGGAAASPDLESTARKLGLYFAAGSAALGWCWDLVRLNVHFAPAVSGTAAAYAANVVTNIPLLMLAVSFVMITAPAPAAEQPEMSPAT